MKKAKQAIILAGGKGKRLGLKTKPKPLISICGKPQIEWIIESLVSQGFTDIKILSSYLAEKIESHFLNHDLNKFITFIIDKPPLGTAGAIKSIYERLDNTFAVIYGDMIFDVDLRKIETKHNSVDADATIVCQPNDHPLESDLVILDEDCRITNFYRAHKKNGPFLNLAASAIYFFNKSFFHNIESGKYLDIGRELMSSDILSKSRIFAYITEEWINDVGTPIRVKHARRELKRRLVDKLVKGHQNRGVNIIKICSSETQKNLFQTIKTSLPKIVSKISRLIPKEINVLWLCFCDQSVNQTYREELIREIDTFLGIRNLYVDEVFIFDKNNISCRQMGIDYFDVSRLSVSMSNLLKDRELKNNDYKQNSS